MVRRKYTTKDDAEHGEVSHFSSTVFNFVGHSGFGKYRGGGRAVGTGGPGAIFWLIVAGFLSMSANYWCTPGQAYKQVREDGRVMGGAMYYLSNGLSEMNMPKLGKGFGDAFLCFVYRRFFWGWQ